MRTITGVATAAMVLTIMAGCVGNDSTPAAPSADQAPEPDPAVIPTAGSISGMVTDSEQVPIAKVDVAVVETLATTRTDEAGRFTLNELEPGPYTLHFTRIGYDSRSLRIDVAADQFVEIDVELEAVEIVEIYHLTENRVAMITFGQWAVQYAEHLVNNSALNQAICNPCSFGMRMQPGIVDALTEGYFEASLGNGQVINEAFGTGWLIDYVEGDGGIYLIITYFKPRDQFTWREGDIDALKGREEIRLQVHGPGPNHPGVMINQRVEVWQTWAHGEALPTGFTALAPEA